MVTNEQWSASKKFAWGFSILILAFLCVEVISYSQFQQQKKQWAVALDQMAKHVSDEAAAVRNNSIQVKVVEEKMDEFTKTMNSVNRNIRNCAKCHRHEDVFKPPSKKGKR